MYPDVCRVVIFGFVGNAVSPKCRHAV
jgi:hypothetical protein